MTEFLSFVGDLFSKFMPLLRTLIIVMIFLVIFNFIWSLIKKVLLKKAKTKKQKSNIQIFSKIFSYMTLLLVAIFAIFSYAGSWTGLGVTVGLFTAALGWALQRPITGIAGWIMVVVKRPFDIGDRIIIGKVRGDVQDISLTHVYVKEIGGIVSGEENSGRIVMIPNSKLFEQDIVNYTLQDEYVLDQVALTVTYECNLDKAMEIILNAAKKCTKEFAKGTEKKPYVLTYFEPNGINVRVRYFAPAKHLQEISSKLTKEIFDNIRKTKSVEIAYPHTEVVFRKKK